MGYCLPEQGFIEVIVGPMFSGKSEELIRRIKRAQITKQKVQVFKPAIDTRYSTDQVVSHDRSSIEAVSVAKTSEILELLEEDTQVVAIDEIQFFDQSIVDVVTSSQSPEGDGLPASLKETYQNIGITP